MGLRALRPNAAIVKVMSLRDSQCIRVVTPDDHVECSFHEILLHDMGEEELPFVASSELNYLRRIWPRALFAFMTRHQQEHFPGAESPLSLPVYVWLSGSAFLLDSTIHQTVLAPVSSALPAEGPSTSAPPLASRGGAGY